MKLFTVVDTIRGHGFKKGQIVALVSIEDGAMILSDGVDRYALTDEEVKQFDGVLMFASKSGNLFFEKADRDRYDRYDKLKEELTKLHDIEDYEDGVEFVLDNLDFIHNFLNKYYEK